MKLSRGDCKGPDFVCRLPPNNPKTAWVSDAEARIAIQGTAEGSAS